MADQEEKNKARGLSAAVVQTTKTLTPILPIAVGAGISAHSIYKNRNQFVDLFAHTTASQVSATQDAVRNLMRNTSMSFMDVGVEISRLADMSGNSGLNMNHVLTAWKQAAKSHHDPQKVARMSERLGQMGSPLEMMNYLAEELRGTSVYNQRAGNIFIQNISAMRTHLEKTGLPLIFNEFKVPSSTKQFVPLRTMGTMGQSYLRMGKALGAQVKSYRRFGDLPGSTMFVEMSGGTLGNSRLKLRFGETIGVSGMVATGVGGQTHNIVGQIGVFDGNKITSTMKYEEWVARHAEANLLPEIQAIQNPTSRDIARLTKTFHEDIRRMFEYAPQVPDLMGALNINDPYAIQRAMAPHTLHLVGSDFKALNSSQLTGAFSNISSIKTPTGQSIYPWSPNKLLHGTFTTINPAEAFTLFPSVAQHARRPGQGARPFIPSNSALTWMSHPTQGAMMEKFKWAVPSGYGTGSRMPGGLALYTQGGNGLDEGMFHIAPRMKKFLGTETIENITLDPTQIEALHAGRLHPSSVLGFRPTGEVITAGEGAELISHGLFPINETTQGMTGLMKYAVRREFEPSQFQKYFGAVKGMGEIVEQPNKLGIPGFGGKYDFQIHMDELRKNRSLHNTQMITGLYHFNMENMQTGQHVSAQTLAARKGFSSNPTAALNYMNALGESTNDVGNTEMVRWLSRRAEELGISPEQAGLVFGAVPEAFGAKSSEALGGLGFNSAWHPHILRGQAVGFAHIASGGPKSLTGAGTAWASMEPRILEILGAGHMGDLGPLMRDELLSRRLAHDPGLLFVEEELRKSMIGVGGKGHLPKGTSALDIGSLTADQLSPNSPNFIGRHGGAYVSGIPGVNNFYVPGTGSMKLFSTWTTPEGKEISTDLMSSYQDFLMSGRAAATDRGAAKAFIGPRGEFIDALHKAYTGVLGGTSGVSGLTRGKLEGSMFLTGVQRIQGMGIAAEENMFRLGLGRSQFERMMQEMRGMAAKSIANKERRLAKLAELSAMSESFFRGGNVGGYLMRHPEFEQYSMTPARFFFDPQLHDNVVGLSSRESEMMVNGISKKIKFSLQGGMGGDLDADIYGVMLGSPEAQRKILLSTATENSTYARGLKDYLVRNQLLKLKAPKDIALTKEAALAADTLKMGLSSQIGLLSFEMSKARAGLLAHGTGDMSSPMSLLSWVEQNVISGKHRSAEQAGKLYSDIESLVKGFKIGDKDTIHAGITSMMDPEAMQYLTSDINLGDRVIPGLRMEDSVDRIVSAGQKFADRGGKEMSGLEMWYANRGNGTMDPSKMMSWLQGNGAIEAELGAKMSTEALTLTNRAIAAGEKMLPHMKPLAFGLGVGVAAAAVLSRFPSTMSPPAMATAQMNNSMGMPHDQMQMDPREVGQPSTPGMASGQAPIQLNNNDQAGAIVNIRGRTNGNFDHAMVANHIRNKIGSGATVSTRLRDDRRRFNAHRINDIINR